MYLETRKQIEREFNLEAYKYSALGRFKPNQKTIPSNGIKPKPLKWN